MGSPLKLDAVKVPEVPDIANLSRFIFTSIGKVSKSFSQELIQEFFHFLLFAVSIFAMKY